MTPTPCHKCPKVPADAPAKDSRYAVELTDRNWLVYRHYLTCRAVRRFPRDAIVERHAALLAGVLEGVRDGQILGKLDFLATLLTLKGG